MGVGNPDHDADPPAKSVGHRELQGDAAHPHGGRQRAEFTVDTFPGHTLRGHVQAFAPASGAEFALLPPDNATGNFTKVVQRISVKILIDDADGLTDRLVPGMSVEARVNAADRRRR